MSTFDRYLTGRLLVYFAFFASVLAAVYWVNRAIGLFDRLIAGGSNLRVFLEFTALGLPYVIYLTLPFAALIATLYGVNRLASDSELIVAQTTGLGPWRLARPVLVFGLAAGLAAAILGNALVPAARTVLAERGEALNRDVTARFLRAGEFLHPGTGVTVYVRYVTPEGELLGLFLQDRRGWRSNTTYTAARAYLLEGRPGSTGPRLVMLDGMAQTLDRASRNLITTTFADFAYDLAGLAGGDEVRRRDAREMGTRALLSASPALRGTTGRSAAELRYLGHARIAEPLLTAVLPLVALGFLLLGGYSRMGLWRQIGAAVLVAIILHLLANVGEKAAVEDGALWMTYLAVLIGAALAAGLLWRGTASRAPFRRGRAA
ncbi:LptF/LptG family permease [Jannaschia sp. LMIT008]|uniref:LptF/LptG family permease n=1 Tax=Jannaschia maritima TaxID=3032585 RepID=UPI002811E420|nr:LptF/LptG family permease [Jannaschia sp. LMIT008]